MMESLHIFDLLLAIKRTFSKTGLISSVNLQALAVDQTYQEIYNAPALCRLKLLIYPLQLLIENTAFRSKHNTCEYLFPLDRKVGGFGLSKPVHVFKQANNT